MQLDILTFSLIARYKKNRNKHQSINQSKVISLRESVNVIGIQLLNFLSLCLSAVVITNIPNFDIENVAFQQKWDVKSLLTWLFIICIESEAVAGKDERTPFPAYVIAIVAVCSILAVAIISAAVFIVFRRRRQNSANIELWTEDAVTA